MSPECEICGEEVVKTYECEECGVMFCKNCGSPHEKICGECSEGTEDWDEED